MRRIFIKNAVIAVIGLLSVTTSAPLGVSAATTDSIKNSYYNVISDTILKSGWIKDNNKWCYFDNNGTMQTGVVKINGKTYCLNTNGVMETGKVKVNNQTYKCSQDGQVIGTKVPKVDKIFDSNNNVVATNNQNSNVVKPNDTTTTTKSNTTANQESTSTTSTSLNSTNVQGLPNLPTTYAINVQPSAEQKILELMNQKRTEAGLKPLTLDNTLVQVSRYKSNHMIQYNYFSHTTPEGYTWSKWLKTVGYSYTTTGENIAYNSYDPVDLFNQWWNSPGHRANMMNASFTKVGIGVVQGNGKYMGTQEFSN